MLKLVSLFLLFLWIDASFSPLSESAGNNIGGRLFYTNCRWSSAVGFFFEWSTDHGVVFFFFSHFIGRVFDIISSVLFLFFCLFFFLTRWIEYFLSASVCNAHDWWHSEWRNKCAKLHLDWLPFHLFRLSIWRIVQLFGLHLLLNGRLASEQHFLLLPSSI